MYLVQTVTSRPRAWSSYTNVNAKDERRLKSMNSVEEIVTYRQDFIAPYARNSIKTAATTYDFPEHPPKKEKKWSFGNLFRRKKKDETESSSDEELQKKNALNKKKRKPDKRKKSSKAVGAFDHIVVPPQNRGSYNISNGHGKYDDPGILSDPSGGFASHVGRPLPRIPVSTENNRHVNKQETLMRNDSHHSHNSLGSVDSLTRKSRREKAKARAVARRGSHRHGSSSDEDSQRSYSSSRFKSDESLSRQRDGSQCRKSRTARTERYIRRLSKDDESILNREAMQRQTRENWQLKLPEERANYRGSPSRSPILSTTPKSAECYVNSASLSQPNFSGLFTIPPSHSNYSKYRTPNTYVNSSCNSSTQDCNVGAKNYANTHAPCTTTNCFNIRSLSCDANIHKSPSPESQTEVMHVQLPIGKPNNKYRHMTLVEQPRVKQPPPPPPPRDPRRIISTLFDNNKPSNYNDKTQRHATIHNRQSYKPPDFANHWHAGYRTASEDHIPTEPRQPLAPRPASVTNEIRQPRFIKRHVQESADKFQYLTEKKPRSRKPIFIQSNDKINSTNYNQARTVRTDSQSSLNFWKRKELEKNEIRPSSKSTSSSPQMFTAQTHVQTKIFLPSVLKADTDPKSVDTVDFIQRDCSPFKPISSPSPIDSSQDKKCELNSSVDSLSNEFSNCDEAKRKSTNLEEALDELEAIYKSLHLGDEDLLERAEQREISIATKKLLDSKAESYPAWGAIPRGAMSDSSFSYEPFNSVDAPKKKKILKKSQTLDRRHDDMAYRKLNKDRANTINNPQAALASVSYLLASPVHCQDDDVESFVDEANDEPNITLDDVVYRNIKHANNSLKVVDPQPPFGIPIGPITPAPNSDYLHAVPENIPRYAFKHKKQPDVVKDDLAFRNLRKDPNKEPALKHLATEDLENNNAKDINSIRKKRAVRSLSANICNLIHRDNTYKNRAGESDNEFNNTSLTDIADAMEIARQILKDKETRIAATKRAFLSDSETKYRKHGVASASSTETITESRLNFLNEMRSKDGNEGVKLHFFGDGYVQSKPPRGSTPDRRMSKESTPIPGSPDLKKDSSSFDDLLTALAVEARETSDRITNELYDLDEDLNKNSKRKEHTSGGDKVEVNKVPEMGAVSEHEKLCEKLLECVVESTELIAATKTESNPVEHVEHIDTLIPESVANIVTTRAVEVESNNPVDTEVHSASEHDYDNLGSDAELDKALPLIESGSETGGTCKSPFEEHKAELIATFKELSKFNEELKIESSTDDDDDDENPKRERVEENGDTFSEESNSNLSTAFSEDLWRRNRRRREERVSSPGGRSCGNSSDMSEPQESRADRMARYKEERRRQLAAQFNESTYRLINRDGSSSSSEGPRMTRTARLRAAATAAATAATAASDANSSPAPHNKTDGVKEKRSSVSSLTSPCDSPRSRPEKDKSSKRKSNLNRSLASEEVPADTNDEIKTRRRQRRFFPPEVLQQSLNSSLYEGKTKTDASLTATTSPLSSPITAPATAKPAPKKTELSIHMENARKGVTASFSEIGRYRSSPRKMIASSPKDRSPRLNSDNEFSNSDKETNGNTKQSNKENVKRKTDEVSNSRNSMTYRKVPNNTTVDATTPDRAKSNRISRRMDELTALTRETLARVERLASKTRESPKKDTDPTVSRSQLKKPTNTSPTKSLTTKARTSPPKLQEEVKPVKKKSVEVFETIQALPVSILKRKVSQDESKSSVSVHTPPVTFSPSVIEPTITNRKQGILKKRRSLDESQVLRHRSCSPDVASKLDAKSILKTQRRSSLEEITRLTDCNLQGILKRKPSKNEEDFDNSLNSPQSILKRRSGASSAGSTSSTHHHVSITTAVILAAAEGAEMILDNSDAVRPILKKKSFSEEGTNGDSDNLKPILKKKSSTDTDDGEEKPKRPILKLSRSSESNDSYRYSYYSANESGSECDVRPILKSSSREETPRPRLSFCADEDVAVPNDDEDCGSRRRNSRRFTGEFQPVSNGIAGREPDRDLTRQRVTSVSDLVMNFEKSTGAIPKKSSLKRNNDRCRTQPITFNEFEASLNYVTPQREELTRLALSSPVGSTYNAQSLLDLSFSLASDEQISSYFSNSMPKSGAEAGVAKMSSDSAFQSLGDGLELEQEENVPPPSPKKASKAEPTNLELQMRAIAEEAKSMKLNKVNAGIQKYRNHKASMGFERASYNRFSTQPVTLDEVQEAAKIKQEESSERRSQMDVEEADPSKLSLSERIKLFSKRQTEKKPEKLDVQRRHTRFITQPITSDEVETARTLNTENEKPSFRPYILAGEDSAFVDRRGILKSKNDFTAPKPRDKSRSPPPKSSMKRGSLDYTNPRSILKAEATDFTYDEGISSNDSDTDSDVKIVITSSENENVSDSASGTRDDGGKYSSKSGSDQTSDESSGGREIQSIIGREAMAKRKQLRERSSNDGYIAKSKSQTSVGNDNEVQQYSAGVRRSNTTAGMPRATIGELQAKLQQSGDSDWRKRLPKLNNATEELNLLNVKNLYNDKLSEKSSILEAKKDELDASAKQWKNRVEKTDADDFSVTGRMQIKGIPAVPINIPPLDKVRRTPKAKRFKGKEGDYGKDTSSTPVSPDVDTSLAFKRSISVPTNSTDDSSGSDTSLRSSGRKVTIVRPDDDTFKSFFKSIDTQRTEQLINITLDDFDSVTRQSDSLLVTKKNIQVQRRKATSKNPVKVLAARSDIQTEYIEIVTGVAERETKRLNVEKLAKNSTLAIEALAGLASKEDFAAVALKKSSGPNISYLPFTNLMLLHVKGRRHVQTRLVEPIAASINQGDNYILITPNVLYNYIGAYSNIIEQSRAADIINHIQQSGDMGCKAEETITITAKKNGRSKDVDKFWKILGAEGDVETTGAGNPDEDEVYESTIVDTNMIYCVDRNELVPLEDYWGKIPKIEMLAPSRVLVFDFGSEMYVWSGKNADSDEKKIALKLAKELWEHGYNYTECAVCPLNVAKMLGDREKTIESWKSESRPEWALFAKITQHRESILFREKFLDWPDYSRIIKVKSNDNEKSSDASFDIKPCDSSVLNKYEYIEPDLVIDGSHLGRGKSFYDAESNRNYEINTLDVTAWIIFENTYEKLDDESVGHFYDGDSYIIRWQYRVTVTGRELSGKPSKHAQLGRDRCIYFCWLGKNASTNDKGAAALLTVELDSEHARQMRITQGTEPPAFLQLFDGKMFVHSGKRETERRRQRLYICRGEMKNETVLIEVPCSMRSLRSRASLIFVDDDKVTVWNGAKSLPQTRDVAKNAAEYVYSEKPSEFLIQPKDVSFTVLEEGTEEPTFLSALEEKRQLYYSLLKSVDRYESTPRMFYFNSISGTFEATEVLCPHRSLYPTPYPFLQLELYSTNQPALYLFDNDHELWLWQGWWPERENDTELSEQTGSGAVRWQAERRAAMQTAIDYWRIRNPSGKSVPAYLVWAGLEPLAFTNLFPVWCDRDDIAELNIKEGKKAGDMVFIEKELALLTRTTYPLAELLQRPLPDGVDPTHLEKYLSPEDFTSLLSVTVEEFQKLPSWRQTALKKEKGLF